MSKQGSTLARSTLVLAGATVLFLVLGSWGYATYLDDAPFLESLYRGVALIFLDFHTPADQLSVPWQLEIARFGVHGVAAAAVILTLAALGRDQIDKALGRGMRRHVVVLGLSELSLGLAMAYRDVGHRVCMVGIDKEQDRKRARARGVRAVQDVPDRTFGRLLRNAQRVVIAGVDDSDALRASCRVQRLAENALLSEVPVHLVVEDPELARELPKALPHLRTLDVCCVPERVAADVLREFPPLRPDAVSAPPVVVGAGTLAHELVRRMARGWHRPGSPFRILNLSPDADSVQDLTHELRSVAKLDIGPSRWSVREVAEAVRHHADTHRPPPDLRARRREVGPLVVVAGLHYHRAFAMSARIAHRVPAARVVMLADEEHDAPVPAHTGPGFVVRRRAATRLQRAQVFESDKSQALADQILADHVHAGGRGESMLNLGEPPTASLPDLPEDWHAKARTLANAAMDGLRYGGFIAVATDAAPLLLTPEEIRQVAGHLVPAHDQGSDDFMRCEFVATLPVLLARTGVDLARVGNPSSALITDGDIETMAAAAHEHYQRWQAAMGDATGSSLRHQAYESLSDFAKESNRAQVRDIPAKLAAVGRTLTRDDAEADGSWLTPDRVERLAEWEHRRWANVHRRAGYVPAKRTNHERREHEHLRPWDELAEPVKEADRQVALAIPGVLAAVALTSRRMDATTEAVPHH